MQLLNVTTQISGMVSATANIALQSNLLSNSIEVCMFTYKKICLHEQLISQKTRDDNGKI